MLRNKLHGRTVPTNFIEIFRFATDGCATVTDTTSDDHMASLQVFFENIVVAPTIK